MWLKQAVAIINAMLIQIKMIKGWRKKGETVPSKYIFYSGVSICEDNSSI